MSAAADPEAGAAASPLGADADYGDAPKLVDLLLREQATLTAVDRFSQRHADLEREGEPLQARYYRELLPGRDPGVGEQYAFRVDLDRCTGCKACVTACHSLNGLGPEETWRNVGLLLGESGGTPVRQTVTTACHHCEDPGCMRGCPVRAYEKDARTGIVRHLDDQCIGCQYCTMTCPYDVPSYDSSRGIVRKCDMCTERLAVGEAPACVQGCPTQAIAIDVVPTGRASERPVLLPLARADAMPDSRITRPTTRYVSERPLDAMLPADDLDVEPGHAHTPLAIMLVFAQLSFGLVAAALALPFASPDVGWFAAPALVAALGFAGIGQAAATLHLGRPLYAFRAILGWRTSWMSREILAFGAYTGALATAAAVAALPRLVPQLAEAIALPPALGVGTTGLAFAVGVVATGCSVMLYGVTGRALWAPWRTTARFFGTALWLGAAGAAVLLAAAPWWAGAGDTGAALRFVCLGASAVAALKIAADWRFTRPRRAEEPSALGRSAKLLRGPLAASLGLRTRLARIGGIALPAAVVAWSALPVHGTWATALAVLLASAGFVAALASEFIERRLFFRAEAARAMPAVV